MGRSRPSITGPGHHLRVSSGGKFVHPHLKGEEAQHWGQMPLCMSLRPSQIHMLKSDPQPLGGD